MVSDQPATSSPSLWSSSSRVSYFGSLLLQSLLSLPLSDTSLSTALVSLSTDDLYRLACDGSGGPVLECLLRVHTATSFSHPLSTQQRLIDALLPRVTELALSASGSYVVERMYGAADVQRKRVIAESLAKDEKRLKHSKPASMLMRRCRVKQIKTSNKVALHTAQTAQHSSQYAVVGYCSLAAISATWSIALFPSFDHADGRIHHFAQHFRKRPPMP